MKQTLIVTTGLLCLLGHLTARGQETATEPAAPPAATETETAETAETPMAEAAVPKAGPKAEAFAAIFKDWKELLTKLRDLKYVEYPEASIQRRVEISKQYDELIVQGKKMQQQVVAATKEAYVEAPGADGEIFDFLLTLTSWCCGTDDYEKAFEMAQFLIDNGCTEPMLYGFAGEAAFCTNQFDLAEQYFNKVGAGQLSKEFAQHAEQIGYYKGQWPKEKAKREAEAKADDLPRVSLKTKHGEMIIELLENEAPNTVANFISLVEKGYYDGLNFHRVIPNFMAQGGCPEGTGGGGPGYRIECECVREDSRKHFRGSLSMAHAGPDTGGSQFFLCFLPTAGLDGPPYSNHHTVFGRVIEGLDQLAMIKRGDKEKGTPDIPDKIIEVKVIRKRDHEYKPETLPTLR